MLVLKTTIASTNPNLPVIDINPEEVAILAMNPTAWISADSGVTASGEAVSLVRDKTGLYEWGLVTPTTTHPPRVITSGTRKTLRFDVAASNPGIMKKTGNELTFPADGIFTLFMVHRIPAANTEGFTATGGNICGNNAAEPNVARFRFGGDSYTGNNIFYNHGSKSISSSPESFPINTSVADVRDYVWHISVVTALSDSHSWEYDGVVLQTTAYGAKPYTTDESRRLTVGGADSPFALQFRGDLSTLILIPGVITAEQKNTVYQYLAGIKNDLTA